MPGVRISQIASFRLDEIYRHTRDHWGEKQAEAYLAGLFQVFDAIVSHDVLSRPIPAEFGVNGFMVCYERHFIYWRWLSDGDVGIVTILHERMQHIERFREDFGLSKAP
jgi:toxin ParE1/3/4